MLGVSTVVAKSLVLEIVEIVRDGIHTVILLQMVMLRSNIRCLIIVVFFLVRYLVDVVFANEYPLILYYKFWQFC